MRAREVEWLSWDSPVLSAMTIFSLAILNRFQDLCKTGEEQEMDAWLLNLAESLPLDYQQIEFYLKNQCIKNKRPSNAIKNTIPITCSSKVLEAAPSQRPRLKPLASSLAQLISALER